MGRAAGADATRQAITPRGSGHILGTMSDNNGGDARSQVLLLIGGGVGLREAAKAHGVTDAQVEAWLDDPEFVGELERARAEAHALAQSKLLASAPASWIRQDKEPMQIAVPGAPMKCTARRSNGTTCNNWAVKGLAVCRNHGGASRTAKAAAQRRLAQHKVGQLMDRFMHAAEQDPLEALVTEVARSAVMVEALAALVSELDVDPEEGEAIYGADHLGDDRPHVLMRMLGDERDRKSRLAKMAIDAGVAERTVRVAERQAALFARVIAAVIDDPDLALDGGQRVRAREVAARELRLVESA